MTKVILACVMGLLATANATNETVWDPAATAATLLAAQATLSGSIETAAGADSGLLAGISVTALGANASGRSVSGTLTLTLNDKAPALANSNFWTWVAQAIATVCGVEPHLVHASAVSAGARRLTDTVNGQFTIFNTNRARNIALGVTLGLVAPGVGLGVGLGLGLHGESTTPVPAPVAPGAVAPPAVSVTTAAPEESGSSIPLWAGILLGLAVLACIGTAIFLSMGKEKKKRAVKKAAPVREEVKVVEEVLPMLAPAPVQYITTAQPAVTYAAPMTTYAAPVQYVEPQVTYAAPMQSLTMQAAPTVTYAAPAPAYTSLSRAF